MKKYGRYRRHVKFLSEFIPLFIRRTLCSECGSTHALLPASLVPYSQVPLADQQEVLALTEEHQSLEPLMSRNYLIDESNVKYILRQFRRYWKQRLLSIGIALRDHLTVPCLSAYSMQFMQIHRTCNGLFCHINIS